ncbi:SDR family NAD(P)-dependent oxidoreductase [Cupriavidus pinatubonensis]|uniref:Cyclopentanol dehydrogenase n=1 Tax=Cupriavidus pinatubonensis TaxID=248026 RepID=A0ABN7ZEG2_9BURK|nr:SDR family oxidoreductase [Cupriavidus pinatubonensis]CAG9183360.1 Cyclopentanol dehydrogenase [Cupriavidus pinatubonensis]
MSSIESGRLAGKVALITGGASGLGLATAKRMLRDGASVAIADVNEAVLHNALEELQVPQQRARAYKLDVRDAKNIEEVVAQVEKDFGKTDILVNSAGVSYQGSVLDNPIDAWERVIAINLTGTYLCTQAVARRMAERKSGRIVMLASISGQQVWSGRVAYSSSKGGVLALAKSCAIDLAPFGITVNSVSPGPIETPQTEKLHNKLIRDTIVNATPMARYGRPDEVADVIAFLASDDARFVTGHDLVVDGGLTSAAILYDLSKNPQPA